MTLRKWQSLLGETQVTGGKSSICREEDLALFEREAGITFPVGYSEFCQVFGPGILGGFIQIDCPCFFGKSIDATKSSQSLIGLRTQLAWEKERQASGERANSAKLILVERLLSNAFVFGSDPNGDEILWDLESYNESYKSCDIYLVPSDYLEHSALVGRDFYEFVCDFCLGSNAHYLLPPPLSFFSEMTGKNFFRFSKEMIEEG